ncbi:MAG: TaqI-like C-terminal specificity domain-containing protein, partial [Bradymonadaceae bacterium]
PDHTIRDRCDDIVIADDDAESRWRPLVSSGRMIDKYGPAEADKFVYIHPDPAVRRRYFKSGHDLKRYTAPKLLMRQTGDAPVVAWESTGAFCLNNLHVVDPRPDTDPPVLRALLGILNSRSMRLFYHAVTMERGRALAQTDIETIERLPVPQPAGAAAVLAGPVEHLVETSDAPSDSDVDEHVRRLYGLDRELVERAAETLQ